MTGKYGPKASAEVKTAVHELQQGELKSGRSGHPVESRQQAVAIGLARARKRGAQVPPKPD